MDTVLQQGIAAIRAGEKATGRRLLSQLVKNERDNETAWLWLSAAVETDEQRRFCLEQVLRINPGHAQAKAALARQRPGAGSPSAPPAFQAPLPPAPPAAKPPSQTPPAFSWEPEPPAEAAFPLDLEVPQTPYWLQQAQPQQKPIPPRAQDSEIPSWLQGLQQRQKPATPASQGAETPSWLQPLQPQPAPAPQTTIEPSFWEKPLAAQPGFSPTPQPEKPRGYAWYHIWLSTLVSPSEENFRRILTDPGLSAKRALGWVFSATVVLLIPAEILWIVVLLSLTQEAGGLSPVVLLVGLMTMLLIPVIMGILQVIIFAIPASLLHLSATLLGGGGKYEEMLFAMAAYSAPLSIVWSVISFVTNFVPWCALLSIPVIIYQLVLLVNTCRAVHDFTVARSLGAMFIASVVLFPMCCLLSYAISNVQTR